MLPMKKTIERTLILGEEDGDEKKTTNAEQKSIDYKSVIADIGKFSKRSYFATSIEDMTIKAKVDKIDGKFEKILSVVSKLDDFNEREQIFQNTLQSIEDYIYCSDKQKCNKIKHALAVKLLKRFVDNNEQTCSMLINMSVKHIKKTTLYRRNKQKFRLFFSWLAKNVLKVI